jgi:hypothetical protein
MVVSRRSLSSLLNTGISYVDLTINALRGRALLKEEDSGTVCNGFRMATTFQTERCSRLALPAAPKRGEGGPRRFLHLSQSTAIQQARDRGYNACL